MAEGVLCADIEARRERQDYHEELKLLRGLIHTVALNGTLRERAKQKFDPFVVLHRVL
jgi:hypothetical protein